MTERTMPDQAWIFRARLVRVIDADTIDTEIDQGLHTRRIERLRLLRVNAPEVRGPTKVEGDAATTYVRGWFAVAGGEWSLIIQTYKSDVFGRFLAEVWRVVDGANLNDDLLASGHAVEFQ